MKESKQSPYQKMFLVTPLVYEKLKKCLNKCEKDDVVKLNQKYQPVKYDKSNEGIRNISFGEIGPNNDDDDRPDLENSQNGQNSDVERMEADEGVGENVNSFYHLTPNIANDSSTSEEFLYDDDFLEDGMDFEEPIYQSPDIQPDVSNVQNINIPERPKPKLEFKKFDNIDIPGKKKNLGFKKFDNIDIPGKKKNLGFKSTAKIDIPGVEHTSIPTQTEGTVSFKKPSLIYRRPIQDDSFNPVFHSTPIKSKKPTKRVSNMETLTEENEPIVETPSMLEEKSIKKLTPISKKELKKMEQDIMQPKSFSWVPDLPLEERIHEITSEESPKKALKYEKLKPLTYEQKQLVKSKRSLIPVRTKSTIVPVEPNTMQVEVTKPVMGKKGLLQYKCEFCGKLFSQKLGLNRHKQSFHAVRRLEYLPGKKVIEKSVKDKYSTIVLKNKPTKQLALNYSGPIFNPNILKKTYEKKFRRSNLKTKPNSSLKAITYEPDPPHDEEMENVELEIPLEGPVPPQDEFITDDESDYDENMSLSEVKRRQLLKKPHAWKRYRPKTTDIPRRTKEIKMKDSRKKQFDSWDLTQFKKNKKD